MSATMHTMALSAKEIADNLSDVHLKDKGEELVDGL